MLRATHDNLVEAPYCPPNLDTTKVKNLKDRAKEKGEKGEGEEQEKGKRGRVLFGWQASKGKEGRGSLNRSGVSTTYPAYP